MLIQLPKVVTYHIRFTLKRLNSININNWTSKYNLYSVCHQKSLAENCYNILSLNNEATNKEILTSEDNVFEKSFKKSKEVKEDENKEIINFQSVEITFACKVLNDSKIDGKPFTKPISIKENLKIDEIDNLLSKDWNRMDITEIITNLEIISWYAYENPNKIDRYNYENILNTILKCFTFCSNNNNMIYRILYAIELSHSSIDDLNYMSFLKEFVTNFKDIKSFSTKELLLINDLLCKLNCTDVSNFIHNSLLNVNIGNLDIKDLIQYAFLLRVSKQKVNISLNKLEKIFAKYSLLMSVEELGLMALTFYKYKYRFTRKHLLVLFMEKLKSNLTCIDPVCIAAIVKSLKGTIHLEFIGKYFELFKVIETQMPYMNSLCLTHILHLQARTLINNDKIINETLQRYRNNLGHLRIKDIERILLTLYQFNYDSKETPFYSQAVTELVKPSRTEEREVHPISFIYCAQYLFQANFCSEEILEIIMNPAFMKLSSIKEIWQAYINIHNCLQLDHPEIKEQFQLNESLLNTFYIIAEQWSKTIKHTSGKRQKFLADVIYNFKLTFGSEAHIDTDLLLPHMFRRDIVVCYDQKNKQFHPPNKELSKYPERAIKYAPNDGNTWYALIVSSINHTLKTTKLPNGFLTMHLRHLKRAGYVPILINHSHWTKNKGHFFKEFFYK